MTFIKYPCDTKQGYMIAEEGDGLVLNRPQKARGTVQKQTAPTLTTGQGGGVATVVTDPKNAIPELAEGEIAIIHTPGRLVKNQNGRRCKVDDSSFTITAVDKDGIVTNENGELRIRYLTPRECLRLQAFPDEAIDRLVPVLPKSALYKVAGNSIAVCCLTAIFKGMFVDKSFVKKGRQINMDRWFE